MLWSCKAVGVGVSGEPCFPPADGPGAGGWLQYRHMCCACAGTCLQRNDNQKDLMNRPSAPQHQKRPVLHHKKNIFISV
ncbi:hypothetical protein NDU88_004654 [Pleurodeles waltl]|uniref:Uncharacterized protein n=1 Tax=Pleurodeles waltl TaxID=8319 RepID=A0AAV7V463_PLEWA|nr:hypothetical protein NDU88_004654 [Pleurodeles waltl]